MAPAANAIFVGIKGAALAVDRDTGTTLWQTQVKGSEFVNVVLQNGDLFAASRGRLYRLDPATGARRRRREEAYDRAVTQDTRVNSLLPRAVFAFLVLPGTIGFLIPLLAFSRAGA